MDNYTLVLKRVGRNQIKYEIWDEANDNIIETNTVTVHDPDFIKTVVDELRSRVENMNI